MSRFLHTAVAVIPTPNWCWLPGFVLFWLILGGCASRSGLDANGRRIMTVGPSPQPVAATTPIAGTPPIITNVPAPTTALSVALPGVTLQPGRLVAPIGTEVIMVSAVHQQARPQVPYQRVEWLLAPQGVGTFLATGRSDRPFFGASAMKLDNNYAVTETAGIARVLNRGTATPTDDVSIAPGQAWITISSPTEGVSYVTAFAPELLGVSSNRQTAVINWVDARWTLSPSRTAKIGTSAPLNVTVYRQSNGAPVPNWRVRYTISGGPPANLGSGAAQTAEVATNAAGQAIIDLTQVTPQIGTNQVIVELLRPVDGIPGATEPLLVGTANTQVVWSETAPAAPQNPGTTTPPSTGVPLNPPATNPPATSPAVTPPTATSMLKVSARGPANLNLGQTADLIVDIQNLTAQPLSGVKLLPQLDPGIRLASGNPVETKTLNEAIPPYQTKQIAIPIRAMQAGRACCTVIATDPNGAAERNQTCINVVGGPTGMNQLPPVNIRINSINGRTLRLGDVNDFVITLENTSEQTLENVTVQAKFDAAIAPTDATKMEDGSITVNYNQVGQQVDWAIKKIPPNTKVPLTIRAKMSQLTQPNRPARFAATVQSAAGQMSDETSVEVQPAAAANPTSGSRSVFIFQRSGQATAKTGMILDYIFTFENAGTGPDKNVQFTVNLPENMLVRDQEIIINTNLKFKRNGQVITFDPVAELPVTGANPDPTKTIQVKVRATAIKPGTAALQAVMRSDGNPNGVEVTDKVEVTAN